MKVKPVYYFHQAYINNMLTMNDCYKFIWEDFDSEEEAVEALNDLGSMIFEKFAGAVNLQLELRKKYVVKMSEEL